MILVEVVGDLGDIIATVRQMLGIAGLTARSGVGYVEVRDVPVLDQPTELGDDLELAELAQALDRKDARLVELVLLLFLLSALLAIERFIGDCAAEATAKVHKVPGLAVLAPAVAQNLAVHHYPPTVLGHLEDIGGQTPAALAEFDGDPNRPLFSPADQLAEPAAPRYRCGDVLGQRILEKAEYIKER